MTMPSGCFAATDQTRLCKSWRQKCMQHVVMGVRDEFAPLLQRCSQLTSIEASSINVFLQGIFADATHLLEELAACVSSLRSCLPPHSGVIPLLLEKHGHELCSMVYMLSTEAEALQNHNILDLLAWVECCEAVIQGLGGQVGK